MKGKGLLILGILIIVFMVGNVIADDQIGNPLYQNEGSVFCLTTKNVTFQPPNQINDEITLNSETWNYYANWKVTLNKLHIVAGNGDIYSININISINDEEFIGNSLIMNTYIANGLNSGNDYFREYAFPVNLYSNNGDLFIGNAMTIITNMNIQDTCFYGVYIKNKEQRISLLESFQQTIDSWKTSLMETINSILQKNDEQDARLDALEDQTSPSINNTLPNYFKYLSSTDRKNIVCGYAEDNHLTQLTDLSWNCTITYRTLSSGRESASCRCKKI